MKPDFDSIKGVPNRLAEDLDVIFYFEQRRRAENSLYRSREKGNSRRKPSSKRKRRSSRYKNKKKSMFLKVDKALSITELSNVGDNGPADYISQTSRSRADTFTSMADTIILEDLISVSGGSKPYCSRSRSRSNDKYSNGVKKNGFNVFPINEIEERKKYEKFKNVTKVIALDDILNHTSAKKVMTRRVYTSSKKSNLKKISRYEFRNNY